MSMITKCPTCATSFRVTPPQLQAQHGLVRCGKCSAIFDGFKTLALLRDPAAAEGAPPDASSAASESAVPASEPLSPIVDGVPSAPANAEETAPLRGERLAAEVSPVPSATGVDLLLEAGDEPVGVAPAFDAIAFDRKPRPRRNQGAWTGGVILAVLFLGAQAAYFFRGEIAASIPEIRGTLDQMCTLLRCTVAMPQRPRQLSIEGSDLQVTDLARPGRIALTATLRSHASTTVGYPALDVVLTNSQDHAVARRIFAPDEYLTKTVNAKEGIAPNAEVMIRLDIDSGDLAAAGFRLDLLPAASPQSGA